MSEIHKQVAESSSFNLLTVYLSFIFGILNTFVLARLLAPEEWALLILTLALINIAVFFCNLFPPNAQESIIYYIPYLKKKGNNEDVVKINFIKHVYKIRIFSGLLILIIFLIITSLANFDFVLFQIILIMTPVIICKIFTELNISVLRGFQKFKLVFIASVLNHIIVTISNFLIFTLKIENPLIMVSYAFFIGALISFLVSMILALISIPLKKTLDKKENNLQPIEKSNFYEIHKTYGSYLILADLFGLLSGLIVYLLFLEFEFIIFITYLTICQISVTSALLFSSSNPRSYISIFSEIDYEKNPKLYHNLFYKLNKFLMIFVCFIVGIMLFYIELYIVVIYSEIYLIIFRAIQIFLFTAFAHMIINNLMILTQSTNNTKINAELEFIRMIFTIFVTFIALIFFDFYFLIFFYLITSYMMTLIAVFLINKHTHLKLKPMIFFKPFFIFLVSFIITYPLNYVINYQEFDKAYLNFFVNGTLSFSAFVIVFYIISYFTKVITKEEFDELVEIIPILRSKSIIIKKLVKIIVKFLPSK